MATDRKTPDSQTSVEQRTEQLRQAIARRDAAQTLDTFQAAAAPVAAVEAGAAIAGAAIDLNSPGFGQTDTTEITGDATFDQDVHDAAGDDVGNEELAGGQSALDDFRKAKDDAVSALAPPDDAGHKPPTIDDPASRIGGSGATEGLGGGGGNSGADATSGGGGGGGNTATSSGSAVEGRGFAEGMATGSDSVSAASGPQADVGGLLGNPRDLVQRGGGNSAASDSDAAHAALSAVAEEQANSTMDKTSVASGDLQSDVDKLIVSVGALIAPAVGPIPVAAYGVVRAADELSGGAISGSVDLTTVREKSDILQDQIDDRNNEKTIQEVKDKLHGFTEDPLLTGQSQETKIASPAMEVYAQTHGKSHVRVPSDPDDPYSGPPSEAEIALRLATNRLLGRNDALVHGPATQIDPGEQGEVFRTDGTPLASSAERAQSLFGTPKDESAGRAPAPSLDGAAPPIGPDGTEVLVEDGNPFTGGQRSEGPEDVLFGTQDPLVGLDRGASDDALPPEEDDSSKDVGRKRSTFDLFDDD